ncbi:hypothetical protein Tco_0724536 [Tanacetum coccineum]
MFNTRYFFHPEKISPPKDAETLVESPILISPSSSVGSSSPETDIQEKDKNKAKNNKTEHGNEKSVSKNQSQSQIEAKDSQSQKVNRKVNPDKVRVNSEKLNKKNITLRDQ